MKNQLYDFLEENMPQVLESPDPKCLWLINTKNDKTYTVLKNPFNMIRDDERAMYDICMCIKQAFDSGEAYKLTQKAHG